MSSLAMLPLAQVREAVEREWGRFLSRLPAVDGVREWRRPTRCAGWAVADLAAHAVWGASMEADALRRYRLGEAGPAQGWTVGASAEPAVIVARLAAAVDDLGVELSKLTDEDAAGLAPLPYGEVPMALFWSVLVMEAGVHAGDLMADGDVAASDGAGSDVAAGLDADVAIATALVLGAFLPVLGAGASEAPDEGTAVVLRGARVDLRFHRAGSRWEPGEPPAGPGDRTVRIEAEDDATVLLYALGRLPAGHPRLAVTGPPALTGAFKRWFPGP